MAPALQIFSEGDAFRKSLVAVPAGRTSVEVDITGRLGQGHGEVSFLAGNGFNFCHSHQLDALLPPAFGKTGGYGAQIAVVGGECPVQLGHQAADGYGFVDKDNVPAGFRQIHGSSNTADTPADYEYFFMG